MNGVKAHAQNTPHWWYNIRVEKRTPTYHLDTIKECFSSADKLAITKSAFSTAQEQGFQKADIVQIIQTISNACFVKSMTSHVDHRVWQDVYNVPHSTAGTLYVKFTAGLITSFLVLSFKAKEEF